MLPPVPHYLRSRISKIIFQCLQTSSLPVIYLCLMSAYVVALTKADKLKKSQLAKTLEDFENLCRPYGCQKVVLTSGENGYGIPELQAVLNAAVAGEQEAE